MRHAMLPDRPSKRANAGQDRAKVSSNVDGIWGDGGLSHRTSRGGGYGRETGIIDLGHEPPLSVDGSEAAVIDRRRVSVQWFSGTILTGLCGAALIGGAVFASLDGEMTFAKVPERVEGALRGAFGANDRTASLHKSDRLPPPGESTAARNVVRVSTVTRVGNRDVMRVRPFIRISGNLSMTTSDLSAKIPPFNAQRMLTDVGAAAPAASDDPNNRRRCRTRCRGFVRHQGSGAGAAQGEDRRRGRARRYPDAGARRLELARQQRRRALRRARQRDGRRQRRAVRHQNGLCRRRHRRRSLCRLRNPGGSGKRHAAAEDQGTGHRRQSVRRTRPSWSRRATPSPRSCAIRAPRPKRPRRSPRRSAPAAATAA